MEIKARDYYFDNAKFILIAFIVIGHFIEPLIYKSSLLKSLYVFFYLFHIPTFALISGYFNKNFNSETHKTNVISRIVIPYLIFQVIYSIFDFIIFKHSQFSINFLVPYWLLWFLVSLAIWQIVLPYFIKLKHAITISFIIAILAGYSTNIGYYLSLSRTITFFPFFLIGYYLTRQDFQKLFTLFKKYLSVFSIIVIFITIYFASPNINPSWLYGSYPYGQLNHAEWYAGIFRITVYILSVLLCISFFSLIPQDKTFFSEMGSRTMYPFLLHGFVVKYFVSIGLYNTISLAFQNTLLIVFSVILTLILSSRYVQIFMHLLVEPKCKWLFRD